VDGSKMLTLRSNVLLRNETSLILDVQVQRWNKTVHDELKSMAPMTSQAVPIWPSKTRANSVWFRPAGLTGKAQLHELLTAKESECGWSETGIKCFEQVSINHYLKCPAVSAEAQPCYLAVNLQVQTKPHAKYVSACVLAWCTLSVRMLGLDSSEFTGKEARETM
jgi:hypothetical protein